MKTIIHTIIRNSTGAVLFLLLTTFSAAAFTNLTSQATLQALHREGGDSFGKSVGISGDTAVSGAHLEDSNATGVNGDVTNNLIQFSGAAYIHVRNGSTWSQQAYLKASNTGTNDQFGRAVAISGDTVVIGATQEDSNATGINGNGSNNSADDSGAAYVFVRNGTTWSQQAYLKASNTEAGDGFGRVVAISGDTIVVGAIGEASNATGVNGNQANNSLLSAGAAYVFVRNGTIWTQQAYLKASNPDANDSFGWSVAISSNTIVVGANNESSTATGVNGVQSNNLGTNSGAAYVFVRNGTTWTQQAYLKASNTDLSDNFGYSATISSDTIAIGANGEDSNATGSNGNQANNLAPNAGAAYVFIRSGTNWSQQAYLKASNSESNDLFGFTVVLADDNIVVGAIGEDSGIEENQNDNSLNSSGAAYTFSRTGTNWSQQNYLKPRIVIGGSVGESVAASSNTVVIGFASTTGPDSGAGESYILAEPFVPPSSPPTITRITNMGFGFVDLECVGTPDFFYDIERADDAFGNSWNVIDTQQASGFDGTFFSTDFSPPVTNAFYRLRQQ